MTRKRALRGAWGLLIIVVLLLAACGGGDTGAPPAVDGDGPGVEEEAPTAEDNGDETVAEPTSTAESQIPDVLVLHPDAFDLVATPASGTYVYQVPGMVAEIMDYMLTELKAKGWEELGQPTLMGHLATLTLRMGKDRLTISMQDNEITEATRVQMLLMQQ
ncbi:MAG: hypothetical protein MUF84_02830 [Anaerolineae bacterium]|jgi:hypothetical protein|nr:hypothetical protein [Anaerolineae bacterium]